MARIRSIHPGIFTDEGFMAVDMAARLLFVGVLTEADDRGIFEWKPRTLKARILPVDSVDVEALLADLAKNDLICRFEFGDKVYGAIKNFCKWQRPKAPKYDHPYTDEILLFVRFAEPDEGADDARFNTLRKLVWDAADGKCVYCETEVTYYAKKTNSLQIDHKKPVSRGGSDDMANLACSCRQCNSLKADMTAEEFRAKFAPAELVARHLSQAAKNLSANSGGTDAAEGGGRMEEGSEVRFATAQRIPPRPPRGRGGRASQNSEVKQGEIARPIGEVEKYRKFLKGWRPGSFWPRDVLGPPPGDKDCRAPAELLHEYEISGCAQ